MEIKAEIKGLKYTPLLCRDLDELNLGDLERGLASKATFILNINGQNRMALSWWVSAKRTRSYPYARVYDTLGFSGRRVTVIPVVKDEGIGGDRDFLQWDTISLMSLLGVYVIIAYYVDAEKSPRFPDKITNQRFDLSLIRNELSELLHYQSDALHWNLSRIEKIEGIAQKAVNAYSQISEKTGVRMHSLLSAMVRISRLSLGMDKFMEYSRVLAQQAQKRESVTSQPKEVTDGSKGIITIKNYLGGEYYFTSDEIHVEGNEIQLIECKHSEGDGLPKEGDIKDGLIKMILFTNLENVSISGKFYRPVSILKLTSHQAVNLSPPEKTVLLKIAQEAKLNSFKVMLNDTYLS